MPDELTPRQVADELGVTVRTVQRWIADGRLPATRVGSRVRVSRSSLSAVAEGAPSAAARGTDPDAARREPRGDRGTNRADRAPAGDAGRSASTRPTTARRQGPTKHTRSPPTSTAGRSSRSRRAFGRRCGPPRLWLPRRESGLRPRRGRCGPSLGRAAGRGDRRDGRQGRGSPACGRAMAFRRSPATTAWGRTTRRWPPRRSASAIPCSSSPAPEAAARACASSAGRAS